MSEVTHGGSRQTERMGTERIGTLLREFAIPATIGLLVNAAYSIVDSIFIGQGVGELGIAATTVAFPISLVMMAIGVLIGGGGNALMAIRLGQGRYKDAEKILGNALTMIAFASVAIAAVGTVFLDEILVFVGATPDVLPGARDFVGVLLMGFMAQGVGFGLNNFIRTTGNPRRAMGTMLIGAVVNTVLNYLFVIVLGWGLRGSAWATVIGQSVAAVTVLQYFLGAKTPVRLRFSALRPEVAVMTGMLSLGVSSFVMQAASSVVNVILNNSLTTFGALDPVGSSGALASMGVVIRIAQFFVMPIMGFVMAAQPIIGYNYGAMKYDRVKHAFKLAVIASTALLSACFVLIMAVPGALVGVFGLTDPKLTDLAVYGLRAYLVFMPLIGFQMLGASYFQATGQALKAGVLSLSRQVLFFIPALLLLPHVVPLLFPSTNALHGVLYAAPVADLLSTLVTGVLVLRELSHLDDKHAATEEAARVA